MEKDLTNETLQELAHQWKQPLARINSNILAIDTLLRELQIQDTRLEDRLDEIESLTHYMSNTMQSFLETNKKQNTLSLFGVIQEALTLLKPTLDENNIKLSVNTTQNLQCIGDSNDLLQVLIVLINNAKDALLERNVHHAHIQINSFSLKHACVIEVIDNAGGMTQNAMAKIFTSHYTTKHSSEGSGIGLELARKIIRENFCGEINVKNFNEGSCFSITIGNLA